MYTQLLLNLYYFWKQSYFVILPGNSNGELWGCCEFENRKLLSILNNHRLFALHNREFYSVRENFVLYRENYVLQVTINVSSWQPWNDRVVSETQLLSVWPISLWHLKIVSNSKHQSKTWQIHSLLSRKVSGLRYIIHISVFNN